MNSVTSNIQDTLSFATTQRTKKAPVKTRARKHPSSVRNLRAEGGAANKTRERARRAAQSLQRRHLNLQRRRFSQEAESLGYEFVST